MLEKVTVTRLRDVSTSRVLASEPEASISRGAPLLAPSKMRRKSTFASVAKEAKRAPMTNPAGPVRVMLHTALLA